MNNEEKQDKEILQPLLEWSVHPLKENWKISLGVIALLLFIAWFVSQLFPESPFFWIILAMFFMIGSLHQFFFPTRYILTEEGIEVYNLFTRLRRKWSYFRNYYLDKRGIQLSPFTSPSRLDSFRGILVLWDSEHKEKILDLIKSYIKTNNEK